MFSSLRALAATSLLLLVPAGVLAQTLGNVSGVTERKTLVLDSVAPPNGLPKLQAAAFQFHTTAAQRVVRAQIYVEAVTDCTNPSNSPRGYSIGIQTAANGKPSGIWVGTPHSWDFDATPTPPTWTPLPSFATAANLAADTTYFLVVAADPATRNQALDCEPSLLFTGPAVDRRPATQEQSDRAVWSQAAGGAWSEVANAEPVFLLVTGNDDPLFGPGCPATQNAAEGNPYTSSATEPISPTEAVEQTFTTDKRWQIDAIEVPLAAASGSLTLELVDDETDAVLGAAPLAPISGVLGGYRAQFSPSLILDPAGTSKVYAVRIRAGIGAAAEWFTSAVDPVREDTFGLCDELSRVGFQGGRGHLRRRPDSGYATVVFAEDALFRVTGCQRQTWYMDGDADGHGRADAVNIGCVAPPGYVASSDDCDDASDGTYPGAAETCDGRDNDCNGAVDGLQRDCPLQEGVCAGSLQTCVAGTWGECASAEYGADWEPVEDRCDGKDNDCNGTVDDFPADVMPLCANQRGVCAGMRGECSGGVTQGCDPTSRPGYQAQETLCDGLDNDCDGVADPETHCLTGRFGEETYELGGCGCSAGAGAVPATLLPLLALSVRAARRRKERTRS